MKLSRATVVGFQHEVPESFLPQTFVEAIKVTRDLGQSYLWIDSLCILQDCSVDWELESSKMAGIYANAVCTLGRASDSSYGGCAGVRSRCKALRLCLAVGTITLYQGVPFEKDNTPVTRRAWCLQERVLARRFIQFADLGFIWFCAYQSVLEYNLVNSKSTVSLDLPLLVRFERDCLPILPIQPLLPVGGDLAPGSVSQAPERRNLLVQERDVEARSKTYSYWYELVEDYTRREITKATDQLPAIAGLAQQVAKRLPEDLYIMGLWLSDLSNGLLWTTTFPVHQEPSPELAPSWSWLSQDGRAEYDMPRCGEIEAYEESKAPTFFFLSTIDKDVSPFPLLRVLASLVRVKCVECVHEHENDRY